MGRRTWIDSKIWNDTRRLSHIEQNLYLHLLCNDNGNSAGYYQLNLAHLALDLKVSEERLLKLLTKPNKFWVYDEETEQVLIPKYTKYNVVKGCSQETKLNRDLMELQPCRLDKLFLDAWVECNGIGSELLIGDWFRRRITT